MRIGNLSTILGLRFLRRRYGPRLSRDEEDILARLLDTPGEDLRMSFE